MRTALVVLSLWLCSITGAAAQVSIGVGLPGVSIGINLPVYPQLVRVPGYPVYYAPQLNSNYFFYDGMYWVYDQDNWYASAWYNGPWQLVVPDAVPLFVLRVPVRYYRRAPVYFRGWRSDAPPRWGEHWGNSWSQNHRGWDNWNRRASPAPAPLPVYQRQYSGNRYPRAEQQSVLQSHNYRYQPRDAVVRQQYQAQRAVSAPAPERQARPPVASPQARERASAPQARPPVASPQAREQASAPQARPPVASPQARERASAPQRPPAVASPQVREQASAPQARPPVASPQAREHAPAPQARERASSPQAGPARPQASASMQQGDAQRSARAAHEPPPPAQRAQQTAPRGQERGPQDKEHGQGKDKEKKGD